MSDNDNDNKSVTLYERGTDRVIAVFSDTRAMYSVCHLPRATYIHPQIRSASLIFLRLCLAEAV